MSRLFFNASAITFSLFTSLLFSSALSQNAFAQESAKEAIKESTKQEAVGDQAVETEPNTYTGWAVLKRSAVDSNFVPTEGESEWISMRGIEMSDSGTKLRLKDGDKATPYAIELIEITYTQTDTTVLKLALYEDGKDKAITYIWGEPAAGRLGMNLRWVQVGLTRVD